MWISIACYSVSTPTSLATHQVLSADLAAPVVGGGKKTHIENFENRTLDNHSSNIQQKK